MDGQQKLAKAVAGRVSRAGILPCVAIFLLATFCSVSATAQTSGFVYVVNSPSACCPPVAGSVSAYTINGATGALTQIAGSPFAVGVGPGGVTVDPTGKFVYVANFGSGIVPGSSNVSAYTIDGTTGALTAVPGSPFPTDGAPVSIAVDPTGQFAYVGNCGDLYCSQVGNNVSAYTINGDTGALTAVPGSPFPGGGSVTVDPTGKFVYVANGLPGYGYISAYTIDGTTGALTAVPGSPFPGHSGRPSSVAVDPTGRFAYVAVSTANVDAYTIDGTSGALTVVPGSPFPDTGDSFVTVDPTGQFAYGVGNGSNVVDAWTIDGTTGALTGVPGSPFGAGAGALSLAVDPTGKFVYVANHGTGDVSAYTIDGTTGALTAVPRSPFPAGSNPTGVAVTAGPAPPPPA